MELMTLNEAAEFFKVCRQTMAKLNCPYHLVPGTNRRRYLKSELLEWARAGCKAETPSTTMEVILL